MEIIEDRAKGANGLKHTPKKKKTKLRNPFYFRKKYIFLYFGPSKFIFVKLIFLIFNPSSSPCANSNKWDIKLIKFEKVRVNSFSSKLETTPILQEIRYDIFVLFFKHQLSLTKLYGDSGKDPWVRERERERDEKHVL